MQWIGIHGCRCLLEWSQRECYDGGAEEAGTLFGGGDQGFLFLTPVLIHFAASNFFCGRVDEAEFADGQMVFFISDGRPEGFALDWAKCVEIAGAGFWVEDGAKLVVGKVLEGFFVLWLGEEQAVGWVSWEIGKEACLGLGYAL